MRTSSRGWIVLDESGIHHSTRHHSPAYLQHFLLQRVRTWSLPDRDDDHRRGDLRLWPELWDEQNIPNSPCHPYLRYRQLTDTNTLLIESLCIPLIPSRRSSQHQADHGVYILLDFWLQYGALRELSAYQILRMRHGDSRKSPHSYTVKLQGHARWLWILACWWYR